MKAKGYTVAIEFNCPIVDQARLEQVISHHFGATDLRVSINIRNDEQRPTGPPRWEPKVGTGAHEVLAIVRAKEVVRWRDIKHVKNARAAIELLLMDGHIEKVRHGVFADGSKALTEGAALKRVGPTSRVQLGERQQAVFDALEKPSTAAELRERFGVSRQAIDQVLKKLMRQGMVRRLATPGEASEWVYSQSGKRTIDVLDERLPTLSGLEKTTLQLIPPEGGVRRSALLDRVGISAHSAIKRLIVKGLAEKAGTPKRQLIRLTQRGLTHPDYDLNDSHLEGADLSTALKPEHLKLLLAIDALGPSRAIDISAAAGVRSKKPPSTGQHLQGMRISGLVEQQREKGRSPIYRLTKAGTAAVVSAKSAGKSVDRARARKAVQKDRDARSRNAKLRMVSASPGQGRTPEIMRLLKARGAMSNREIQESLSNPFRFARSAGLATYDLSKRGWVECASVGEKNAKRWQLTDEGRQWLEALQAGQASEGSAI